MKKTIFQIAIGVQLYVIVSLLSLTAVGFLVVGVYLLLAEHLVTWAAVLLTGTAILVALGLVLLIAYLATRAGEGQRSSGGGETASGQQGDVNALVSELLKQMDFDARDAAIIALLSGTVLGASPELRSALFGRGKSGER